MKAIHISKIREAWLITNNQRQAIIEHFKLDCEGNRFLAKSVVSLLLLK